MALEEKSEVAYPAADFQKEEENLRRWLRHVETLSATEEEMVYICEPEVGRNLSDEEERSVEDLIDFQEGRDEGSDFRREIERDQADIS
jgi:hypothetical protein